MIRRNGNRRLGLSLPATLAAVFVLAVLFIPAAVGAAESRDSRERRGEETSEPVILQIATPPPLHAAGDPESESEPGVATIEADPIVDVANSPTDPGPGSDNPSCPEGWINPPGSVNQDIGCLPDQVTGIATTDSSRGELIVVGSGGSEHPGHNACPDGYTLELLLQQQPDGGLWWSYGCIPDGPIIPDGPGDITSGDRVGRDHPGHNG